MRNQWSAAWIAAIVALVLVLPRSASAGWCDDGTFPGELRQGIWRDTRVQVPPGTTGNVTLLVVLHPYGGILDYMFQPWGADLGTKVATRQSPTIATYPCGHWFAWNAYNIHLHVDPWHPESTPRVDDIGLLNSLIRKTTIACMGKGITVTTVKLLGYSNGATLAQNYLETGTQRPLAVALMASMIIGDRDSMGGGCVPGHRWDTPFWEGDANLYDRVWNAMGLGNAFFDGTYKYSVDSAQGQSLLAIKCWGMNHLLQTGSSKNTCNGINVWELALRSIGMP